MKLIITDLDNTLLRSDKSLSDYTVEVLRKCREKGHRIAFATARAENAMVRFVQAIEPDSIVSNGGATVRAEGTVIYQNWMSSAEVATILQMCRAYTQDKGLITVEAADGYYCNFIPRDPDRRAAAIHTNFDGFKPPSDKITAELEKEEWGEEIVQACPGCTVIGFSGEIWRRFAAGHSDKKTALQILVDHLGISTEDVIAFGDDRNDLGMLTLAGTAVAVANAIDEVKAVADVLTDSNDRDGVARFLEKHLLFNDTTEEKNEPF